MTSPYIQLEGSAKFGPVGGPLVDYSNQITNCVINRTRATVSSPATWGDVTTDVNAGARTETLTINFLTSVAAASFWAELWDALDTDSGELDFEIRLSDAAVGADNPEFSGTLVTTGVDTGGQAGEIRSQSQTFPIKRGTLEKATS